MTRAGYSRVDGSRGRERDTKKCEDRYSSHRSLQRSRKGDFPIPDVEAKTGQEEPAIRRKAEGGVKTPDGEDPIRKRNGRSGAFWMVPAAKPERPLSDRFTDLRWSER